MKLKSLLSLLLLAISFSAAAQPRIAVLNFNAGVGVHQSDVDGLSAIFNTFFTPQGYTVVERTRVSRILEEHKMQGSDLTETDMARLGELLNVPVIVIGDVNRAMGQYNIDVRAVNVETGAILAKDGAEWAEGSSYRETMRAIAERLSKNIPLVEFKRPEPEQESKTKERITNPTYRSTGGYLRISSGYPIVGSLSYNHQITPYFMVGGGVGTDGISVPIFTEAEIRTPQYNWSLFINFKIGLEIEYGAFFAAIHAGVSYQNLHLGIGYSVAYFDEACPSVFLSYNLPLKFLF